jgi:hypothetical protein
MEGVTVRQPNAKCACGSTKAPNQCCIPLIPPVALVPIGITRLSAHLLVTDANNRPARTPTSIDYWSDLTSWSALDRGTVEIQTALNDLLDCFPESRREFRVLGGLLGALHDAIEAARYHQRQFLSRLYLVKAAHAIRQEQGEVVAWANLADRPLISEFEACMVRMRSSLDALARLLSYLLGWKKLVRFGALSVHLGTAATVSHREAALLTIVNENDDMLKRYRTIRDVIVHEGRSGLVDGAAPWSETHEYPRIDGQRAAECVFESWRAYRQFVVALTSSLRSAV